MTVTSLLVSTWAALVVLGFGGLLRYKSQPGDPARPPQHWPSQSALRSAEVGATLVLFAHPHCPCTQASISELARLMADLRDKVSARVVIVRPAGVGADWDDTTLRRRAAGIPGVSIVTDAGGGEAERFRVAVSGTVLLYDAQGRLRFAGGITASRGHEGDSLGRRRIVDILTRGGADRADAPVFGCGLVRRADARGSIEEVR